eukprot:330903_1
MFAKSVKYSTIVENKINELWNIEKRRNFIERIEIHFGLNTCNMSHEHKFIYIKTTLPHSPSSELRKNKFLLFVDDQLLTETKNLINEYSTQMFIEKERQSKIIVHQYIQSIMDDETSPLLRSLFEINVEYICFNYYCNKQYEIEKMCNNPMNYFGIGYKKYDYLRTVKRNKKIVRQMAKGHRKIFCSATFIRQIPRLLGPHLNRLGKFPTAIKSQEYNQLKQILDTHRNKIVIRKKINIGYIYIPRKKLYRPRGFPISCCIGDINMNNEDVIDNIMCMIYVIQEHVKWKSIRTISVKRTMGKSINIYRSKDIVAKHEMPILTRRYGRKLHL